MISIASVVRRSILSLHGMVLELGEVVQDKVEKLCALVTKAFAKGKKANLHQAFRPVSLDVASGYAFGQSYALLDTEDIGDEFFRLTRRLGPSQWVFHHFPGLLITSKLPSWVLEKISDPLAQIVKFKGVGRGLGGLSLEVVG